MVEMSRGLYWECCGRRTKAIAGDDATGGGQAVATQRNVPSRGAAGRWRSSSAGLSMTLARRLSGLRKRLGELWSVEPLHSLPARNSDSSAPGCVSGSTWTVRPRPSDAFRWLPRWLARPRSAVFFSLSPSLRMPKKKAVRLPHAAPVLRSRPRAGMRLACCAAAAAPCLMCMRHVALGARAHARHSCIEPACSPPTSISATHASHRPPVHLPASS